MSQTIAVISDTHLGYRHRFSMQRLKDYEQAFLTAVERAKEKRPGLYLFGGDLLHHSKPHPISIRTVLRTLMELAQLAPVVVAIGNHEIEGHLSTTYAPLFSDAHPNIHILTTQQPQVRMELDGQSVLIHGFQYLRNRKMVEEKLLELAGSIDNADEAKHILLLHQGVEQHISPHELTFSLLREVSSKFDVILLGHDHGYQKLAEVSDITPTYIIGSTEHTSFNQASQPTGFMVFEGFDFANPQRIEIPTSPMKKMKLKWEKMNPLQINSRIEEIIKENQDAKLLQVNVEVEVEGNFLDIRRDWDNQDFGFTVLDVNVTPTLHDKPVTLEKISISEETIKEYFEKMGWAGEDELLNTCIDLFNEHGGEPA